MTFDELAGKIKNELKTRLPNNAHIYITMVGVYINFKLIYRFDRYEIKETLWVLSQMLVSSEAYNVFITKICDMLIRNYIKGKIEFDNH